MDDRHIILLGERIAKLEASVEHLSTNSRDLWKEINSLKEQLSVLESVQEGQDSIMRVVKETLQKVNEIEKDTAVTTGQRNMVIGIAGWIAAGVGAAALFIVKEFVWPVISSHIVR